MAAMHPNGAAAQRAPLAFGARRKGRLARQAGSRPNRFVAPAAGLNDLNPLAATAIAHPQIQCVAIAVQAGPQTVPMPSENRP